MLKALKEIRMPVVALLIVALLAGALVVLPGTALGLGDIIKVFGIGYAVSAFSKPINDFINRAMGEQEAAVMGATKVVPILSVGTGGFIGAAQVVGAPDKVRTVQAVGQLETRFEDRFSMRVLIPITTKRVTGRGAPKGVSGTGVSALVDFRI